MSPLSIPQSLTEGPARSARSASNEVRGVVSKVITAKDDGWGAISVRTEDGRDVKASGSVAHLRQGDAVVLGGEWSRHPKYGDQLKVTSSRVERPSSAVGIERYLEGIANVGAVTARSIVRAFGDDALRVIEEEPARLAAVEGVGPVRAEAILAAVRNRQASDDLGIMLGAAGVPARFVAAILKRWGDKAPQVVQERPYSLIGEFEGIGFKTADSIARAAGISLTSEERMAAGVLHVLNEAAGGEGHTMLPKHKLLAEAAQLMTLKAATIEPVLEALDRDGLIVVEEGEVFSRRLHTNEVQVAERLLKIRETPCYKMCRHNVTMRYEAGELPSYRICTECGSKFSDGDDDENLHGMEFSREQEEAIDVALGQDSVLIINGGPGTGKSYVTRFIVENYLAAGLRVRLAAPTGKAARRLSEATGEPAETIHRLLEYSPVYGGFTRNRENPIEADVVVVDEVSMVDVALMRHLLMAVPDAARLILVGDSDQLPSVGPGRVLADVIASGVVRVVCLKTVFRQAAESRIIVNAHRMNRGEPFVLPGSGEESDFYFTQREGTADAAALVVDLVAERIPAKFGLDPRTDVQVLTPMNKGDIGARKLNALLQAALNPDGQPVGNRGFRVGDRVMQLRNNYNLEIFNGDTGRVLEYRESDPKHGGHPVAVVDFGDGRKVEMESGDMGDLALAYASTIHKSQGSEYPAVVMVAHSSHWIMLQRNLFYTGITRAKRLLCVVGEEKAIRQAARKAQGTERYSRLATRLREPGYGRPARGRVEADFIRMPRWHCDTCGNDWNGKKNSTECPECGGAEIREVKER